MPGAISSSNSAFHQPIWAESAVPVDSERATTGERTSDAVSSKVFSTSAKESPAPR
jgi:hypothetical protein